MAPKSIVDVIERSGCSASPTVYEAGWISANHKSKSSNAGTEQKFSPWEKVGTGENPSLPVLFNLTTNETTASMISATEQSGDNSFVLKSEPYGSATTDTEGNGGVSNERILELCSLGNGGSGSEETDYQLQGVLTGGTDPATEFQVSMGKEVACISTMNMEKIPADVGSVDAATSLHEQSILHSPGDAGSDNPRSNGAQRITSEITLDPMVQELTEDESKHHRGLGSSAENDNQQEASIFVMNGGQGTDAGLAIIDSGAAVHVTGNISLFSQLGAEPPGTKLYAANGDEMQSYGSGSICLPSLELKDVFYVPCVNKTIVSVSKLNELGYSVNFNRAGCSVRDDRTWTRKLVGKARHFNGQYELDYLNIPLSRTPASEGPLISLWKAAWSRWSSFTKTLIQRDNVLTSQRPSV